MVDLNYHIDNDINTNGYSTIKTNKHNIVGNWKQLYATYKNSILSIMTQFERNTILRNI